MHGALHPGQHLSNDALDGDVRTVGYGIVIPGICIIGIFGNVLNLVILRKKELKDSTYTYLTGLAIADLTTISLSIITAVHRGFCEDRYLWQMLDFYVYLPLAGISSTCSVFVVTVLSVDRYCRIRGCSNMMPAKRQTMARKNLLFVTIFSVIVMLPSCFMYNVDREDGVTINELSNSTFYTIYSWLKVWIIALVPSTLLTIVNAMLMSAVRSSTRRKRKLISQQRWFKVKCINEQTRLTITMVTVSCVFVVAEVPSTIANRTTALYLLYDGEEECLRTEAHQLFVLISTVLVMTHYSMNFFLYCTLNYRFNDVFKKVVRRCRCRFTSRPVDGIGLSIAQNVRATTVVNEDLRSDRSNPSTGSAEITALAIGDRL
ncbi:Uncharacterised protein g1014 [Pycnogonum litorale]